MPDEVVHSKPEDPYWVATRWDDEGFHITVSADIPYDEQPVEEVKHEMQTIVQDVVETIFRGKTFKRHVGK